MYVLIGYGAWEGNPFFLLSEGGDCFPPPLVDEGMICPRQGVATSKRFGLQLFFDMSNLL